MLLGNKPTPHWCAQASLSSDGLWRKSSELNSGQQTAQHCLFISVPRAIAVPLVGILLWDIKHN